MNDQYIMDTMVTLSRDLLAKKPTALILQPDLLLQMVAEAEARTRQEEIEELNKRWEET